MEVSTLRSPLQTGRLEDILCKKTSIVKKKREARMKPFRFKEILRLRNVIFSRLSESSNLIRIESKDEWTVRGCVLLFSRTIGLEQ